MELVYESNVLKSTSDRHGIVVIAPVTSLSVTDRLLQHLPSRLAGCQLTPDFRSDALVLLYPK